MLWNLIPRVYLTCTHSFTLTYGPLRDVWPKKRSMYKLLRNNALNAESKCGWCSTAFPAVCSYWWVAVWLYKYFLVTPSRFYFIFVRNGIEIFMMRVFLFSITMQNSNGMINYCKTIYHVCPVVKWGRRSNRLKVGTSSTIILRCCIFLPNYIVDFSNFFIFITESA